MRGIGTASYPVLGFGDVNIWTFIKDQRKATTLKNVLYVPNIGTNLFSIAAATDMGWKATFDGSQVHFTSPQRDTIMVGERVGRKLHLLAIRPRDPSTEQQSDGAYPSSLSIGLNTWHRRLAHTNYKTII